MINLYGKCSKRELKDILEGVINGLDSDEVVELLHSCKRRRGERPYPILW